MVLDVAGHVLLSFFQYVLTVEVDDAKNEMSQPTLEQTNVSFLCNIFYKNIYCHTFTDK